MAVLELDLKSELLERLAGLGSSATSAGNNSWDVRPRVPCLRGGVPLGVPSDPKCPHNRVRSQTDATPRTHALTWSVTSRLESLFAPRCV